MNTKLINQLLIVNRYTINALSPTNQDNGYNNEWPSITRAESSDRTSASLSVMSGSDTWTADLLTGTNYNCHGHVLLHAASFLKSCLNIYTNMTLLNNEQKPCCSWPKVSIRKNTLNLNNMIPKLHYGLTVCILFSRVFNLIFLFYLRIRSLI